MTPLAAGITKYFLNLSWLLALSLSNFDRGFDSCLTTNAPSLNKGKDI